jgi:hypothetical protein
MRTLPIAELIEDFSIYPRHAVDDAHVASLVNALKAGVKLPPVVIERKSKRIADGWHRVRAYRRVVGPEAVIEAEEVDYANDAELLKDAIRRNSAHGRKLDGIDQVRVIELCREHGIERRAVAVILNVPEERIEKLSVRIARAEKAGPGTVPGTTTVALKRPLAHLAGTNLTTAQVEAHQRAPGVSYLLIVHQLGEALACGFINRADERLMNGLRALSEGLHEFLREVQ